MPMMMLMMMIEEVTSLFKKTQREGRVKFPEVCELTYKINRTQERCLATSTYSQLVQSPHCTRPPVAEDSFASKGVISKVDDVGTELN